jgi:crotonobetainyl-CoA:carnitine CoA-transferase CaiB-like acyl-CoA transferase
MNPLEGIRVVTLAINLPGPVAAARLCRMGASVVKVEPPEGDPLCHAKPEWYVRLLEGQDLVRLDLKDTSDRPPLNSLLEKADLLLTANRPASLDRLGLAWPELHARYPRLCQVGIIGYPPPLDYRPGHDLNYQASQGLLLPPELPRTCIVDMAGAERVVAACLEVLLARLRGQPSQCILVSLAKVAQDLAEPLSYGLTTQGGILGGGAAGYNLYRAREGWIALAALEPRFWRQLQSELGVNEPDRETLQELFLTCTDREWEAWAEERELPITAVRDLPDTGECGTL